MSQTNILLAGVGGQGVVTAGILIGNAVTAAGMNAVMSEIHGMSQRGGVVLVELRMGDVYGPIIPDGAADLLLGFEAVETLRALKRAGRETTVIMSTERIVPVTVNVEDASYPDIAPAAAKLREGGVKIWAIDAPRLARSAGSVLSSNIVLLGAAFSAGFIPVDRTGIEKSIENMFPTKSLDTNLKALELGIGAFQALRKDSPQASDPQRSGI